MSDRRVRGVLVAGLLVASVAIAEDSSERVTRLQGAARLDRNRPVVGATVLVTGAPGAGPARVFATSTDEKGAFRLEDVPEGSYRVEFRADGLAPVVKESVDVRFPFRAVVEVTLSPAPKGSDGAVPSPDVAGGSPVSLRGTVSDAAGKGIAEVPVQLVRSDGSRDPRGLATGPDGTFASEGLAPGRWRIEILPVGFLPIRVETDLVRTTALTAVVARQPPGYQPAPLDLMPPEEPIAPPGFEQAGASDLL